MRPTIRFARAAIVALALGAPVALAAQERREERHGFDEPIGRLMAFYSATLAFSPVGAPQALRPWSLHAGAEATYVPYLNRQQRTAGSDKAQATNLAPVLPRPRATLFLPGGVALEASWIPPVRVFGIRANVYSLAVSREVAQVGEVHFVPRVAGGAGRVRGAITCNEDLAEGTTDERVYYQSVCHGRESDDYFEPRYLAAELLATRGWRDGTLAPYAGVGVRAEDIRFDIGVQRADGTRDPDHPILELRTARAYGVLGGSWSWGARARLSGELFYQPGSLVTVRLLAGWRVRE